MKWIQSLVALILLGGVSLTHLPTEQAAIPFGENVVLDDGRLVVTPWPGRGTGVFIGQQHLNGPTLRLPDACIDGEGHTWVVAHDQDTTSVFVLRDTGVTANAGFGYGLRAIIRCGQSSAWAAFSDSATTTRTVLITSSGDVSTTATGVISDGSGGNGMRQFDVNGVAQPNMPLDSILGGYNARMAITQGDTTIAEALPPLDGGVLVSRGAQVGFIVPGGLDAIRLSKNGQYYSGVRYVGEFATVGIVPAVLPPVPTPAVTVTIPKRYRFGSFFAVRGGITTPPVPGDFEISSNGWGSTNTRDVIAATVQDAASAGSHLIATYTDSNATGWDLNDISAKTSQFHVPIVLNWDGDCTQATWPNVSPSVKSIEFYPLSRAETPSQTVARVDACARKILESSAGVMLVRATYLQQGDPNWTLDQAETLLRLDQDEVNHLVADFPTKSISVANFAWQRAQYGASAQPRLGAYVTAEANAMPAGSLPAFAPTTPVTPSGLVKPEVTVDKWDLATLRDGAEAIISDPKNPTLGYKMRVWVENGSMYFQIINAAGEGHTGARRAVIR